MTNAQSLQKMLDEAIERLVSMTDQAFQLQVVKNYLNYMAKFWDYSFANMTLIAMQFPNATRVAGIKTWNKLGRRVKKGEKGIAILVPVFAPKEAKVEEEVEDAEEETDDEPEATKREAAIRFRAGYVFDISQTEGEPLPEVKWWSDGDAPEQLLRRIIAAIKQDGISIEMVQSLGGPRGVSMGGRIAVLENATPLTKASTFIHEWAHEILRDAPKMDRSTEEVIVEAVAYVVLSHFGLDPANNANYIALWQGGKNLLRQNLAVVKQLSASIIEKIEEAQGCFIVTTHS